MTWEEISQLREAGGDIALLPIGATDQHGPHLASLRCALEVLRSRFDDLMVAIRNLADVSPRMRREFDADASNWHANAAETELMPVLAPELVRPERLAASDDADRTGECFFSHPVNRTGRNGVTGRPTAATKEDGARLFSWMVEDLAAQLRAARQEQPPLGHSYFAAL